MLDTKVEKLQLLIVEDSPTQALLLRESLEKHQFQVNVAKDGLEGLEELKRNPPHAIISDIEMPRMNGYEFCKHVKAEPAFKGIPVILLTGLTDSMDVIRGLECGADSFLTKPCQTEVILNTLQDLLANKKLHKELAPGRQMEFFFGGERHNLSVDQVRLMDLLLSTYSSAMQKNLELERTFQKLNVLYAELKEKNEELKKLNEQKNQFLGMAAHDLRNPLGAISGLSDLLMVYQVGKIDEKSFNMLERIRSASVFMLQLINDLLDISVIESGTVKLNITEVDITKLIQESLLVLKNAADKKQILLIFHPGNTLPVVQCDANKVSQILNNLLNNAIKFSKPKSTILVKAITKEQEVVISVKDEGVGMTSEVKQQIFQPFSKGSKQGTEGEKGTGLGLAIVHKVVTLHKGKVWVESEIGKGSTFFVALPIRHL